MPHRLVRTADGFRGTFLFLVGFMFLAPSISYLLNGSPLNALSGLEWVPGFVMLWHVGVLFTATTFAAAAIGGFSKYLPGKVVAWGFLAAMVAPVVASVLACVSLLYGAGAAGLLSLLPNTTLAALIYLASEWPNPMPAPPKGPA